MSVQFTDDDGDFIELRAGARGPVELCAGSEADSGRHWVAQRQLRWDPASHTLHDDGGRMPLHGAQDEGLLDRIVALVAASTTTWLEPVQLPHGWQAHVDATTLQPYFVDEAGCLQERPPPAPAVRTGGGGSPRRGAARAATAEVTVLFCGQTLTRTDVAEVARCEPHSGYEAGWVCDGCSGKGAGPARDRAIIYHGAVEASNPLELNAFDLCERCAANIPEAERRYQMRVDRTAERERRQFRDQWQGGSRGSRRGGGGGSGGDREPRMMAMARVSSSAAVSSPTRPQSPGARMSMPSPAKRPHLTGGWKRGGGGGKGGGAKVPSYYVSSRYVATVTLTSCVVCLVRRCCSRTAAATASTTSRQTRPCPHPTRTCVPH